MKCKHIKSDGKRCRAAAQNGRDWCWFHDPDGSGERRRAQSAGGQKAIQGRATVEGEDLPLESAEDVKRALAKIVNECRSGRLDYRVSNACFVGLAAFLKALDQVDVEAELASLREEIEALKGLRVTG